MSNVLHKLTLKYKKSVNTAEYLDGSWLINPDMKIIKTVPKKYWKVVGEKLLEMNSVEKILTNEISLVALRVAKKAEIANVIKQIIEKSFPPEKQRTLFYLIQEAKIDGLANRAAYLAPLWIWIKKSIQLKHKKNNAIDAAINAAEIATVTLNIPAINASTPNVSIRGALAIVD